MKRNIYQKSLARKKRIKKTKKKALTEGSVFESKKAHYEMSERITATENGGIGAINNMVNKLGLHKVINDAIPILKRHRPYHEAHHVLNIAYNTLCGGKTLNDLKLLKDDEAYLNLIGTGTIPDATTAGDFLRRFSVQNIEDLQDVINDLRIDIWKRQDRSFFDTAYIDIDGVLVTTTGECKDGMDISYKGTWGYYPMLVSLANTNEPLKILNRRGNAPSRSEESAVLLQDAADLCQKAGFKKILMRGDSAFSLTKNFDEWNEDGFKFVFSYQAKPHIVAGLEESLDYFEADDWTTLIRKAEHEFLRERPENIKDRIVNERGYKKLTTTNEDITEFPYSPHFCEDQYRIVAVRKTIVEERYGKPLFEEYKYLFYITNDDSLSMYDVVHEANKRCNQENLNEQLQNGTQSLKAPLGDLVSNWAYMVVTSLAWSLKSWMALTMPKGDESEGEPRVQKSEIMAMEFRGFVNHFIKIPAQVIKTARRIICRLLAWKPKLQTFLCFALE